MNMKQPTLSPMFEVGVALWFLKFWGLLDSKSVPLRISVYRVINMINMVPAKLDRRSIVLKNLKKSPTYFKWVAFKSC